MFCQGNRKPIQLTPEQIQQLMHYANTGDVAGGWKYLAGLGDRYADDAAAIVDPDGNPKGMHAWMKNAVAHIWDQTVGEEVRREKFNDVALSHFRNYAEYVGRNHGTLPDTYDIEKSYTLALERNGVSREAAIDLQINTLVHNLIDRGGVWGFGLAMDLNRVNIEDYLTLEGKATGETAELLSSALAKGLADSVQQKGLDRFKDELIDSLTDMAKQYSQELVGKWFFDNPMLCAPSFGWLNPWNQQVRSGQSHTVDPLALDLDGDGLETVSHNRFSGSLFDHSGEGIRTATGWLKGDDGFLVYDRNGNGVIDDGTELFGDSTILADGSRAAHGYAALAEWDSNGDGKVDAADEGFASLRVWRDLNQDGISQSDELFTLADVGVLSLSLQYTTPNQNLGNGNFLAQSGSYTRTDGSTALMGDLDLGVDRLFARHSQAIELTEEQMQAANLQGMGRVRDLRQAAALSGSLADVLAGYGEAANDKVWEWGFQAA